jgi:hypothetical protein
MADKQTLHTFADVFAQEQALFTPAPSSATAADDGQPKAAALSSLYDKAAKRQFAGLALSGGGIRSATFNLGVLQALADLGLLSKFDYLSTVSGGGYIGGWLSKWIHGELGGVAEVEKQLRSAGDGPAPRSEPPEVQFLRKYSNYLTPKSGLFTADTWTLICTYVRNTLLNMTMLVTWMALLFLLPRVMLLVVDTLRDHQRAIVLPLSALIFLLCVSSMALNISLKGPVLQTYGWLQDQKWVLRSVCYPLMIAAFLGSIAFVQYRDEMIRYLDELTFPSRQAAYLLLPGLVYSLFWGGGWLLAQFLNRHAALAPDAPKRWRFSPGTWRQTGSEALGHALCAIGALAVGTLLTVWLCKSLGATALSGLINVHLVTLGMPAVLCVFGVTMTLMIGLIGRLYSDASREWWARQGAWTVIMAVAWLVVCCATFYLPPLLAWAFDQYVTSASLAAGFTTLVTYLGLRSGSGKGTGQPGKTGRLELVAQLAPYAFSLLFLGLLTTGLLMLIAGGLPAVTYPPSSDTAAVLPLFFERYLVLSDNLAWRDILPTMAACALAALLLGWRVDINKFSLYMMYRLRLARAYFGASNNARMPHPFTGFDPGDDLPLNDLLHPRAEAGEPVRAGPVPRPYHLFNSAVNLVQGSELAWQTRKAANFVFSPAFCGFELPAANGAAGGFRPTTAYATQSAFGDDHDNGIKLGTAVAISGAAASPNMGYHSSPPLSFLMTLFNLRLGRWSPNPAGTTWRRASPSFGLFCIVKELFGLTNAESDFVYLSDGGHFENLGLYELVRRRCQLIVVVDASCDNDDRFEDLGNAIRKCLTDFNVPITLDVAKLPGAAGGAPRGSFVNGRIHYHQADGGTQEGVLLYLKPALTGGENADIFNYSRLHPSFPHETTADQWFDESQFDSYRSLGRHIATRALGQAVAAAARGGSRGDEQGFISRLSDALATPRPPPRRVSTRRNAPARRGRERTGQS